MKEQLGSGHMDLKENSRLCCRWLLAWQQFCSYTVSLDISVRQGPSVTSMDGDRQDLSGPCLDTECEQYPS